MASSLNNAVIIAKLKDASESGRVQLANNQLFLQSLGAAVLVLDQAGHLVYLNHPEYLDLPADLAPFLTRPYATWLGGWSPQLLHDLDRVFKYQDVVTVQNVELHLDGDNIFPVDYSIRPLREGSKEGEGEVTRVLVRIERRTHELRNLSLLTRYLSPDMTAVAMADSHTLLEGQRTTTCLLSVDLHRFARTTAALKPADALYLFNNHMTNVQEGVAQAEGLVLKYAGNGVLASFGLPYPRPGDVGRAVRAALAIVENVELIHKRNRLMLEGISDIGLGLVLVSGDTLSGVVGKKGYQEYTVLGGKWWCRDTQLARPWAAAAEVSA